MIQSSIFYSLKRNMGESPLLSVLTDIRSGKYKKEVDLIRQQAGQGDKAKADQLKKKLPAFTVSATYGDKRRPECLHTYNPLLTLDIDGQSKEAIPRLRALAEAAEYTVACFLSPGGHGLKVIVYSAVDIEPVPANHRIIYNTMQHWYASLLDVEIDVSGSDAGRLCFVSCDPALFLSPRFNQWMCGVSPLPDDIVLLKPYGASSSDTPALLFTKAIQRTEKKYRYADGNRNNYVYLFASHCNRLGLPREETERYAREHFADLPGDELASALESAYSHTDQHGKKSARKRDNYVKQVRTYLREYFWLRKNVVKGQVEYRPKRHKRSCFQAVTDYWENSLWCALQLGGIEGKVAELRAVIHSDFSEEYDPFASYFARLAPWDGKTDYIAALASTVRTTNPAYWLVCLRKWLVATVACAIDVGSENHSVLLLSGAQGLGKTTWCRHLVPPELAGYVYSGNLDPSTKDASLLMSDCFLIILDELSGQSRMELNRLKAMITKDVIRERRAYAHNAETYVRRASFAATVNDSQVLTDRTGSRRFLCFEALEIDYLSPVDHAGIYAQALALYRCGVKYWFSDTDIAEINTNNEPFQQSSPEEELFFTYFRRPERFEAPLHLSSSDIVAKLSEKTRLSITSLNVNNLGKMLKRMGFEQTKRKGIRLFEVIELDFEQVKAIQKGIALVNDEDDKLIDNKGNSRIGDDGKKEPELPF